MADIVNALAAVTVRIPTPLRTYTGGLDAVTIPGATVRDVIQTLGSQYEGIASRILDEDGQPRPFVNVFLDERNLQTAEDLEASVQEGSVVTIMPAVAGGALRRDARLAALRDQIREVTPEESYEAQQGGAVLVDIREPEEVAGGSPVEAIRIVRGFLELRIEESVPDLERPLHIMCAGGVRSLLAADDLEQMGYTNVSSVAGGYDQWKSVGLPVEVPESLSATERERYARHLVIPEVGEAGQLRLRRSKVLLVGAGGLGSPAALYLAAAGVGTLGIVDDDVVDRSNLQRQILHTDDRVGTPKVDSARATLIALNPDTNVDTHHERLSSQNAERLLGGYDVVVDGSDNFATRYLVNDVCVLLGIPNVHGSIYRFEGQVSVFWPGRTVDPGPCYRCLYPAPPPPELAPSCAEAGVLGILPGVIGTLEAVETVKILLGVGEPLVGRLLHYDALASRFSTFRVERRPDCAWCGDEGEVPELVDYEAFCATAAV